MSDYYIHYKNKPYLYHGIAKHSETLEDFVVYETLYKNDQAKLWIRPKEMFFENLVDANGKPYARFRKQEMSFKCFENQQIPIADTVSLLNQIFESSFDIEELSLKLQRSPRAVVHLAYFDGQPVALKLGYMKEDRLYSWLGGVLPGHRSKGLAKLLLTEQHQWAKEHQFKTIQTKTLAENTKMIALNSWAGFRVIDTENSARGLKLILQKEL